MEFQLSKFLPYKEAILAKAAGDLKTARINFARCLEAGREAGGAPMISGLLFRLGDVEALDGQRELAIQLYEEAMQADPGSPLALISYAESLYSALDEPILALEKLEAAELLLSPGWIPSADDISLEGYKYLIAKVRAQIAGSPTGALILPLRRGSPAS